MIDESYYTADPTKGTETIDYFDASKSVTSPVASDEYIERNASWVFKGKTWNWSYKIPKSMAFEFANKQRRADLPTGQDYLNFLASIADPKNPVIKGMSDNLYAAGKEEGYDYYEMIGFFAAFVQGTIPYDYDSQQFSCSDYIQYPIELLVNEKGDCEDKSTLLANLLAIQNYDVKLLYLPSHVALGVLCGEDYSGYKYSISGKGYCYLESTQKGWRLGEMPDQYRDISVYTATVPR